MSVLPAAEPVGRSSVLPATEPVGQSSVLPRQNPRAGHKSLFHLLGGLRKAPTMPTVRITSTITDSTAWTLKPNCSIPPIVRKAKPRMNASDIASTATRVIAVCSCEAQCRSSGGHSYEACDSCETDHAHAEAPLHHKPQSDQQRRRDLHERRVERDRDQAEDARAWMEQEIAA